MRRELGVAALAALVFAPYAAAQVVEGPNQGTWGAEAGAGGTLLRFRSASSAWILSANASHTRVDVESSGTFPISGDHSLTRASLMLGIRRYRNEGQAFRPFHTIAPMLVFYQNGGPEWGVGGMVELGAAHFFSRHVSLGASGALAVNYAFSGSSDIRTRMLLVDASAVRVLAAVYF